MIKNKEAFKVTLFYFLGVVVLANIWAYFYVTKSRFIYSWDNTLYWSSAKSLSEYKVDMSFFKMMYHSIGNSEYNMLPAVLPALIMKIFGTSRLVFIITNVNIYFVPSVFLIFILSRRYCEHSGAVGVLITFAFLIMLFTVFVGFPDLGAVGVAFLIMLIYFSEIPLKYIITGVLLIFVMMFRRYFAFFSLAFVTAMLAESIIYEKKKSGIFVMLVIMGVILVFGFPEFLTERLLKDYGDLYSSYKFSLKTDFLLITRYFGLIPLILILFASVRTFISEKNPEIFFLWIQILVCFLMFICTQTHGQQHLLLYVPSLVMLVFFSLKFFKCGFLYLTVALFVPVNTLIDRKQPESLLQIKNFAFIPDFSMRPRVRNDIDEILDLKRFLNKEVPEGQKVGVLASGLDFNSDILKNCEASLGLIQPREDFFLELPCVDSKDKDFSSLFSADFLVVAFPPKTHLGEERQKIIVNSVNCFYNYSGFANAFLKISHEIKIDDMSIFVYKRVRTVTEQEKKEFMALFT